VIAGSAGPSVIEDFSATRLILLWLPESNGDRVKGAAIYGVKLLRMSDGVSWKNGHFTGPLTCEAAIYQLLARLFRLSILTRLVLSFAVAGATTPSGPKEAVSGLMSSWNAKDAHAFASQFTENATFVNVNGTIWIGNKEIEERLANAAVFKTSHAEIKPESLRFLRPDAALVYAGWTITGNPRGPQARSYLMTLVVGKRNDRWLIFTARPHGRSPPRE